MITAFAALDEAMLLVVKQSKKLENARFTSGERMAREQIIKAANNLQKIFEKLEAKINNNTERTVNNG